MNEKRYIGPDGMLYPSLEEYEKRFRTEAVLSDGGEFGGEMSKESIYGNATDYGNKPTPMAPDSLAAIDLRLETLSGAFSADAVRLISVVQQLAGKFPVEDFPNPSKKPDGESRVGRINHHISEFERASLLLNAAIERLELIA